MPRADDLEFVRSPLPHVEIARIDPELATQQIEGFLRRERAQAGIEQMRAPTVFTGDNPIPRMDWENLLESTTTKVIQLSELPPRVVAIIERYEDALGDFGVVVWRGPLPDRPDFSMPDSETIEHPRMLDEQTERALHFSPNQMTKEEERSWLRLLNREDPVDDSD